MNPFLAILLATIIWGSSGAFIKTTQISLIILYWTRTTIPTIILLITFLITGNKQSLKKGNKFIYLCSLINTLRLLFYFPAFIFTSVGKAVIILYTWPFLVIFITKFIYKQPISKKNFLALIFSFIGVCSIILDKETLLLKSTDLIGISLMLLCSFSNALFFILFKKASKNLSKMESVYYQNLVGTFLFSILTLFFLKSFTSFYHISLASLYSFLIGVIGFSLFFYGLKKLPVHTASAISFFETISAMLLGYFFLGEVITIPIFIGAILIISSGFLIQKDTQTI